MGRAHDTRAPPSPLSPRSAHFASPIKATPAEFAGAFSYLDGELPDIRCEDWRLLDGLNKLIEDNQLGAPAKFDFKRGCPS